MNPTHTPPPSEAANRAKTSSQCVPSLSQNEGLRLFQTWLFRTRPSGVNLVSELIERCCVVTGLVGFCLFGEVNWMDRI